MNIRVIPPLAPVEPGTTADGSIQVFNDSTVVETYRIEVLGAEGWVAAEPSEISMFPGQEAASVLAVRPPRSAAVRAGTHRIGIRVVCGSNGAASVEEADVEVAAFESVAMTLRPATAHARRRARFTATVTNAGNIGRRYWFEADDADDLLRFRTRPTHTHLEPGESRVVRIGARFLGRANPGDRVPVTVSAANDGASTQERATVAVRTTRGLQALAVAGAALVVAAIVLVSVSNGTPTSNATAGTFPTTTSALSRRGTPTTAAAEVTTAPAPPTTVAPPTTMPRATTTTASPTEKTTAPPTTTTVAPTTSTAAPTPVTIIRFDTPAPVKGAHDELLTGDEFTAQGITLAGAPSTSTFCATATRVALLATNPFGAPSPFLTSATGTNARQCNNVPVTIHFSQPVKRVKLTVWGASADYLLSARNAKGKAVVDATVHPDCCSATSTVEVKAADITDVTYGLDKSITAVTQIEFEI